jgi:hypothetical protein
VIVINAFAMSADSGSSSGVLANRSSLYSLPSGPIQWNAEVYDDGWHDNSTDPEKLTVPSGVSLARPSASSRWNAAAAVMTLRLNGADYNGSGRFQATATAITRYLPIVGAIIAVSPGDYFTAQISQGGTDGVASDPASWFAVEPLSSTLKYALVRNSANQAVGSTATAIPFDTEIADTNGFHESVTNPSRLTVPSGVTLVRLSGSFMFTTTTEIGQSSIFKNGATFTGTPQRDGCNSANNASANLVSPPLVVTPGDYFQLMTQGAAATNAASGFYTWFQIEEVDAAIKRCLAYRSTAQSLSATTWTAVSLDAEVYDTNSMHEAVTHPTRITVPAGCTQARATFSIRGASQTGSFYARVTKNGSETDGMPYDSGNNSGSEFLNMMGAWVPAAPGDYFELEAYTAIARSTTAGEVWLCLECQ